MSHDNQTFKITLYSPFRSSSYNGVIVTLPRISVAIAHLEVAVDLGEADLGGVLEGAVGLAPRPHRGRGSPNLQRALFLSLSHLASSLPSNCQGHPAATPPLIRHLLPHHTCLSLILACGRCTGCRQSAILHLPGVRGGGTRTETPRPSLSAKWALMCTCWPN